MGIITHEFRRWIYDTYTDGFHVYFRHIKSGGNELLGNFGSAQFRLPAEYIAAGYFHNSQITEIDHRKKTVSFSFKKHVDPKSGEKRYAEMRLGIYGPDAFLSAGKAQQTDTLVRTLCKWDS
jgi:hypothetical protein